MDIKTLEKLTTKRLLAFYKAERKRQNIIGRCPDDKCWDVDLVEIKKLLDEREHIKEKMKTIQMYYLLKKIKKDNKKLKLLSQRLKIFYESIRI